MALRAAVVDIAEWRRRVVVEPEQRDAGRVRRWLGRFAAAGEECHKDAGSEDAR
jgi:hypothetical protein